MILHNGTAHFFAWLIKGGATEKVLQFIMQPKFIYNKKNWFHRTKKNVLLNMTERFKQGKNLLIDIILRMKTI
jgi:hypothetical protein